MTDYLESVISDIANTIKNKISNGFLYGVEIDMDDENQLILAAYLLGQAEERKIAEDDSRLLEQIRQKETRR